MSQTLLVHNDQAIIDLLGLNLPTYVGTDVVTKSCYKDAQTLIEHHPGIHLIICADKIDDELTADLVKQLQKNLNKKFDLIVLGERSTLTTSNQIIILPESPELKKIIQAAAKLLKVTPKKMMEMAVPDFYPIDAHFCSSIKTAPCEIYILTGESDYQKKFETGDPVHAEEIKMLIEAGHGTFFVNAANRLKFVNHVTVDLLTKLSGKSLSPEEKVTATNEAMQVVHDQALNGEDPLSKETEKLASVAIKSCLDIAKANPTVATLLKKLFANRSSFLYRHTQLIIYLTQHILTHVEWGSTEQKEKLAFVAFFHDLYLTDDKLAKFNSDYAVNNDTTLTLIEKETLIKHARNAAEAVQKFSMAPLGADVIIMQHHGMTSGQGFAKSFTNSISPLAIVFIVAEEMSHLILEHDSFDQLSELKDEMLDKLSQKFPRSNYQRVIETLREIQFS